MTYAYHLKKKKSLTNLITRKCIIDSINNTKHNLRIQTKFYMHMSLEVLKDDIKLAMSWENLLE